MTNPAAIVRRGDRIRLHYTTYSQDECVIETSLQREPLVFTVGSSDVVEGINRAVVGLAIGQKHRVPVLPEAGFGERQPRWQQAAPRAGLPARVGEGDQLTATIGGASLDVWIRSLRDEEMVLDANHPLAGEALIYELEVVQIEQAED